jgi:hypothetical protein
LTLSVETSPQGPLLRANQEAWQLETIASAWRSAIPRQKPLAEVFTQLQQLLKQPVSEQLPKPLRSAIQSLVQQAPSVESLSRPDKLHQVLQQAGPQLEAHLFRASLTQQAPNVSKDLKAGFLRVAQQVLQWQSQQVGSPGSTAPATPANTSPRAPGVELYHALLNAAGSKTMSPGGSPPPVSRPLLPPLLNPTPITAIQDNNLPGRLQQLLERFLPASFANPVALPSVQAGTTAANTNNATAGQALLRIAAEILNQLEAGLARIQHHQLTAMPSDEPVRTLLNMELPVFSQQQFSNVGVRIEQEEAQQQEEQNAKHNWRAVVSFDLPALGKVQAIISIQQQRVSTEFRSENEVTTRLFREHINLLEERLHTVGLKTSHFHFSTGTMVDMNDPAAHSLLHTEA